MKKFIRKGFWSTLITIGVIVSYGGLLFLPFSKPINTNTPIWGPQLNTFEESFYGIEQLYLSKHFLNLPQNEKMQENETLIFVDDRKKATLASMWNETENREFKLAQSYTVYIKNPHQKPLTLLTYHGSLILGYQEAKDACGNWIKIEESTIIGCGNSYGDLLLSENEVIASKIPVYDGNFETELRLVTNFGPSNTYIGKINESQFIYED